MRETLEAVAAGDLTPTQAEAQLRGYATTEAGRFDAARVALRGGERQVVRRLGRRGARFLYVFVGLTLTSGGTLLGYLDLLEFPHFFSFQHHPSPLYCASL